MKRTPKECGDNLFRIEGYSLCGQEREHPLSIAGVVSKHSPSIDSAFRVKRLKREGDQVRRLLHMSSALELRLCMTGFLAAPAPALPHVFWLSFVKPS
jgi:hypothetical protein